MDALSWWMWQLHTIHKLSLHSVSLWLKNSIGENFFVLIDCLSTWLKTIRSYDIQNDWILSRQNLWQLVSFKILNAVFMCKDERCASYLLHTTILFMHSGDVNLVLLNVFSFEFFIIILFYFFLQKIISKKVKWQMTRCCQVSFRNYVSIS